MNPTAPATYRVLLGLLARGKASQRELASDLDVSFGQVSNVFRWLEENGFVERGPTVDRGSRGRAREVYLLTNPTGLLRAISLFRPMERLRRFSVTIDVPKEKLLADLRRRAVVFCLGTALERYSRFYRSDEISFYALADTGAHGAEAIRRDLSGEKEGITKATCYVLGTGIHGRRKPEPSPAKDAFGRLARHGVVTRIRGDYVTTKVQTVVDLFCDGKAFAARDLLKDLWGVQL